MALPGDISPPPAPGDSPQSAPGDSPRPTPGDPGGTSEPGNSAQQSGDDQRDGTNQPGDRAGSLPGLPRLFFAAWPDQQEQPDSATTSDGQPGAPGLRAFGQPPQFGQPAGSGQPPQFGQSPQFGQPSGSGQPPSSGQPPQFRQPPQFGQPTGPQQSQFGQPGGLGQPGSLGRPGQRPPARAARPRPTRPPDRELRQRAIASLVLGVISLVALLGLGGDLHRGVYLLIFSAAIGIAACVIGITAVVKARKTGSYRPRGAVGGIVLGTIAALLSIPILATYLAFPRQVDNYVKCLTQSQSLSSGGQRACMDRFYKSIHLGAPTTSNGAVVRISAASGQRRRPA
jgi:hypothetical protein